MTFKRQAINESPSTTEPRFRHVEMSSIPKTFLTTSNARNLKFRITGRGRIHLYTIRYDRDACKGKEQKHFIHKIHKYTSLHKSPMKLPARKKQQGIERKGNLSSIELAQTSKRPKLSFPSRRRFLSFHARGGKLAKSSPWRHRGREKSQGQVSESLDHPTDRKGAIGRKPEDLWWNELRAGGGRSAGKFTVKRKLGAALPRSVYGAGVTAYVCTERGRGEGRGSAKRKIEAGKERERQGGRSSVAAS